MQDAVQTFRRERSSSSSSSSSSEYVPPAATVNRNRTLLAGHGMTDEQVDAQLQRQRDKCLGRVARHDHPRSPGLPTEVEILFEAGTADIDATSLLPSQTVHSAHDDISMSLPADDRPLPRSPPCPHNTLNNDIDDAVDDNDNSNANAGQVATTTTTTTTMIQ